MVRRIPEVLYHHLTIGSGAIRQFRWLDGLCVRYEYETLTVDLKYKIAY